MYATGWSLVPPLVAIILALITKEVYSSLFVGIVVGGLFYTNFNVKDAFLTIFTDATDGGMATKIAGNVGILVFLVVLGILVALMNKAGGSAAYGRWATGAIKTRRGALLSTFALGVLVFVDDYGVKVAIQLCVPLMRKHRAEVCVCDCQRQHSNDRQQVRFRDRSDAWLYRGSADYVCAVYSP